MQKDPKIVAQLAAAQEDENWQFRTFLKHSSISTDRLNAIAHEFGRAAEIQMDCTTCGACCRDNCIPLSGEEITQLAQAAGLSVDEFTSTCMTTDDDGEPAMLAQPCRFLTGNRCDIYESRPDACRGYPYIGDDIRSRMIGILERAAVCPIVFEMLERLKAAMSFRPFR